MNVCVFEDKGGWGTPDSVFPNNWFSTHTNKRMALYPMHAVSRRKERRKDIISSVIKDHNIKTIKDYSPYEEQNMYFEGTGVMVLDRVNNITYVAKSKRSNKNILSVFCNDFEYNLIIFTATDNADIPIYHTNVMMGIGTGYALVCLESIKDQNEKNALIQSFKKTGHEIIDLKISQINEFAGNVLELDNGKEKLLAISNSGYASLDINQIQTIEKYSRILVFDIPTIKLAGGSIRCMLAEIF